MPKIFDEEGNATSLGIAVILVIICTVVPLTIVIPVHIFNRTQFLKEQGFKSGAEVINGKLEYYTDSNNNEYIKTLKRCDIHYENYKNTEKLYTSDNKCKKIDVDGLSIYSVDKILKALEKECQ